MLDDDDDGKFMFVDVEKGDCVLSLKFLLLLLFFCVSSIR